jgi:hypothetical protein
VSSDTQPPVIDVVRRLTRDGRQFLPVECPYCPEEHLHGTVGPNFGDGDGHRVSGCVGIWRERPNPGYILREVPDVR